MDDTELRLDGNAAGGLLNEIFPFEMTAAEAVCAGCGTVACVGELMLYRHGMGSVLRCRDCDTALLRVTQIRGSYTLDLTGMSFLRIDPSVH
jgi:hypothetical protein